MSLEPFSLGVGTQTSATPTKTQLLAGVYGGPTTATGWGFSMPKLRFRSRAASTLTVELTGDLPETGTAFDTGTVTTSYDPHTINKLAICTLYDASNNVIFVGRLTEVRGIAHPEGPRTIWTFSDTWWDLQNLTFQHFWNMTPIVGGGGSTAGRPTPLQAGNLKGFYFESELNLFSNIMDQSDVAPWNYMTVDVQIAQIIIYAAQFCKIPVYASCTTPGLISPTPTNQIQWMSGLGPPTGFPLLTLDYIADGSHPYNHSPATIDPDYGNWNMPLYGVKAITCAEAILICLHNDPSAVTWFDYSTITGPTAAVTLHITARANCTGLTLPYAGNIGSLGPPNTIISHKSSDIKSRPDLQYPGGVVIQYKQVDYVPSQNAYDTEYGTDSWGPLAPASLPTGQDLGTLVCPISLAGYQQTNLTGQITTRGDLSSYGGLDVTTTAFWQLHKPDLVPTQANGLVLTPVAGGNFIQDTTINGGSSHPYGITCVDDLGNAVAANSFYELVDGNIAPWMTDAVGTPIICKWVTITAYLNYYKKNQAPTGTPNAFTEQSAYLHPTTVRIRLTNAPTAADISHGNYTILSTPPDQVGNLRMTYSAVGSFTLPEYPPVGLAENIFNSVNVLQWEGDHIVLSQNIVALYGPQYVLNLSGGLSAWSTMNAVIYDVEHDFFYGRTTINFGPFKDLSVQAFFQLLTMWKVRWMKTNPNTQATGTDAASSQIDGSGTPKENTAMSALPSQDVLFAASLRQSGNQNVAGLATVAGPLGNVQASLVIAPLSNGAINTSGGAPCGYVQADIHAIPPGIKLYFQCITYQSATCGPVHRWVLCSDEIANSC